MVGGGLIVPALFSRGYFYIKGIWSFQILWVCALWLIHYEHSENQKNFIGFSQYFWVILNVQAQLSPPLKLHPEAPHVAFS